MTIELIWSADPELRRPILVAAFAGWFDAARGATGAVEWLTGHYGAVPFAAVDPDAFFDFQQERPEVHIGPEGLRGLRWPSNELFAASTGAAHDLVLLSGVEPHLRWPRFTDAVLEGVRRSGCELVVTLGAVPSTVPHTRPFGVFGSATNAVLAERLGLQRPQYEGPTGIVGALHDHFDRAGVPAIALRVSVPHYAAGLHSPKASMALARHLERVTAVPTGYRALAGAAAEWERDVSDAVAGDDELAAYLPRLEAEHDHRGDAHPSAEDGRRQTDGDGHADGRPGDGGALDGGALDGGALDGGAPDDGALDGDLPTGDDLAAEFERFLREQRGDA